MGDEEDSVAIERNYRKTVAWALQLALLAAGASALPDVAEAAKASKTAKAAKKPKTAQKTATPASAKPAAAAQPSAAGPGGPADKGGPAEKAAAAEKPAEPSQPAGADGVTAQQVANGLEAFYAKQPGFRANFTQVVTKKGLSSGLKREGSAWLKKGDPAKDQQGKMRWDYPGEEVFYFCNGEVLWSYERRERLAVKVPVKNSQVYQATQYLVGQGNLARDFALELVPSALPGTLALRLTPKQGTQTLRSLTLVVDKTTFAVKASKLVDPVGDSTDLVWRDVRYEAADDKLFEWTPPLGTTVKDMSKPK
jgi:outer membrane lipoprotein-sorting protein